MTDMNTSTSTSTWIKIPAVTTGGKPYFYQTYAADRSWRGTVVWNRSVRAYAVEACINGRGAHLGYVATVAAGKALYAQRANGGAA